MYKNKYNKKFVVRVRIVNNIEKQMQNSIVKYMTTELPEYASYGGHGRYTIIPSASFGTSNISIHTLLEYIRKSNLPAYKEILKNRLNTLYKCVVNTDKIQVELGKSSEELSKLEDEFNRKINALQERTKDIKASEISRLQKAKREAKDKNWIVQKLFRKGNRKLSDAENQEIERLADDTANKYFDTNKSKLLAELNEAKASVNTYLSIDDALNRLNLEELIAILGLAITNDDLDKFYVGLALDISKEIQNKGMINAIHNGIEICGTKISLYGRESYGFNPNSRLCRLYTENIFGITSEYFVGDKGIGTNGRIDLVLSLNGLPIIAIELKSLAAGQSADEAKIQLKNRNGDCFKLNRRFIAYVAMDESNAFVSTDTKNWIPFNQYGEHFTGSEHIYKYVFKPSNLIKLIDTFIDYHEDKNSNKGTIIFPRYHQFEVVERICSDIVEKQANGVKQQNYLINHSAGSGKTFSILWLGLKLSELYTGNTRVFDKIIIISDRRQINQQISNAAKNLNVPDGVIVAIDDRKKTSDLEKALNSRCLIVITTIHKFSFVKAKLESNKDSYGRFGIIIDEAHSSQGGELTNNLYKVLVENVDTDDDEAIELDEDNTDEVSDEIVNKLKVKLDESLENNELQMFAFTATPVEKTFKLFGSRTADGKYKSFHTYSMGQAIREGYILNVLKNYKLNKCNSWVYVKSGGLTTYAESGKVVKQVVQQLLLNPAEIRYKAEEILNHFMENVYESLAIDYQYTDSDGKTKSKRVYTGKAMVVSGSRIEAYLLYREINRIIEERSKVDTRYSEFRTLISFTGNLDNNAKLIELAQCPEVIADNGKGISTSDILFKDYGIKGGNSPDVIKSTFHRYEYAKDHNDCNMRYSYRILVVANQFQTGFDEPFLNAMYVCKKLHNVSIVQTLSRLNRCNNKANKQSVFVYDFCNDAKEIEQVFTHYMGLQEMKGIRIDIDDIGKLIADLENRLIETGILTSNDISDYIEAIITKCNTQCNEIKLRIGANLSGFDIESITVEEFVLQLKKIKNTKERLFEAKISSGSEYCGVTNTEIAKIDLFDTIINMLLILIKPKDTNFNNIDIGVKRGTYRIEEVKINIDTSSKSSTLRPNNKGISVIQRKPRNLNEIVEEVNSRYNKCLSELDWGKEYSKVKLGDSVKSRIAGIIQDVLKDDGIRKSLCENTERFDDILHDIENGEDLSKYLSNPGIGGVFGTKLRNKIRSLNTVNIETENGLISLGSTEMQKVKELIASLTLMELYKEAGAMPIESEKQE